METVKDRSSVLIQANLENEEVLEKYKELEARHGTLTSNLKKNVEEVDWMIDNLNMHQDLASSHAEWQKEMWEKLHTCTGSNNIYIFPVLN